MKNEFILTPVTGRGFVGRKAVIRELVEELSDKKSHVGFCIYGKRRVGKTSVLMELKYLLQNKNDVVIAYMSLYDIADLSIKTFADELVDCIASAYQDKSLFPIQAKIKKLLGSHIDVAVEMLKSAKVEAKLLEHIKILFQFQDKGKNYTEYLRHAFNFSEVMAQATGTKCVLILDEFPEVLGMENGLQLVKMMRTSYETQKTTALVISGSLRKTLDAVATDESSPFYRQLVPKHMMPFDENETGEFLNAYLQKKVTEDEIKKVHDLTGGMPFYLQFIGRSTKYSGNIISDINTFIEHEGDVFFKNEFEKLSDNEKRIVMAMPKEESLTDISKRAGLPVTTVGRYLPILAEKELVAKESRGSYRLVDKLFGYWIRVKYK